MSYIRIGNQIQVTEGYEKQSVIFKQLVDQLITEAVHCFYLNYKQPKVVPFAHFSLKRNSSYTLKCHLHVPSLLHPTSYVSFQTQGYNYIKLCISNCFTFKYRNSFLRFTIYWINILYRSQIKSELRITVGDENPYLSMNILFFFPLIQLMVICQYNKLVTKLTVMWIIIKYGQELTLDELWTSRFVCVDKVSINTDPCTNNTCTKNDKCLYTHTHTHKVHKSGKVKCITNTKRRCLFSVHKPGMVKCITNTKRRCLFSV